MEKSTDLLMHQQSSNEQWTEILRPEGSLLDLKLREVWRYRDLVLLFVRRDFVATYKQTVLGPAWHILQPLITTVLFTIVFGQIAGLSTGGVDPLIFYMCSTICWGYFSRCLNSTASTFSSNAGIFGKVYFPRQTVPIANVISALLQFGIQFVMFMAFWAYFFFKGEVTLTWAVILIPYLLLLMALMGLALGNLISAMTTKYRDMAIFVGFGVQLLMYLSPVIYPLSSVPAQYKVFMQFNPIAPILEGFRYAMLGIGSIDMMGLMVSTVFTVIIFLAGLVLFNKVERSFMDTV